MTNDVIEAWSRTCKPAQVRNLRLLPMLHNGEPIVVQRGQANTYCLHDETGNKWVLKKFRKGQHPGVPYLHDVQNALPRHVAFESGTERLVITGNDLKLASGSYYDSSLHEWLDETLLMPRVSGMDWTGLAEEIREGDYELPFDNRLLLCRNLAGIVRLLEQYECAHRDLSGGNVFVQPESLDVCLIDFDSTYQANVAIPKTTTAGTAGHVAPFLYDNGTPSSDKSWCALADRFALAVLIAEFLVVGINSPLAEDGSLFHQRELGLRSGSSIDYARDVLRTDLPSALELLDTAINALDFESCPSPDDWIRVCSNNPIPTLDSLEETSVEEFKKIFKQHCRRLITFPSVSIELPADPWVGSSREVTITLPHDPWSP